MAPSPLFVARAKAGGFIAAVGLLVFLSFWSLDLQWARFLAPDALRKMVRFLGELFPPNLELAFLSKLLPAALETLAMSALGTLIAAPALRLARARRCNRSTSAWSAPRGTCRPRP